MSTDFRRKKKILKYVNLGQFLKTLSPNSNNGIGAKPCVFVHATNRKYRFVLFTVFLENVFKGRIAIRSL